MLAYIYFNYLSVRDNQFEFEEVSVYGLSGEEYIDKYRMALRWMNDYEALKRVKMDGDVLIVPIICTKPGLRQDPINYKIYINEKLVKYSSINSDNNIIYSKFYLSDMGYEMGSFLEILPTNRGSTRSMRSMSLSNPLPTTNPPPPMWTG